MLVAAGLELLRDAGAGSSPCLLGTLGSPSSLHQAPISRSGPWQAPKWQLWPGQHFWGAKEDAERKRWGCSLQRSVEGPGVLVPLMTEKGIRPPSLPRIAALGAACTQPQTRASPPSVNG